MTIRFKLNANMILMAIGILVIAGFSLSGMKFVQNKLHVLTEKSTPYQLKTIALQRTLQEHISNLLKVTAAATDAEINQLRDESSKSLEEVRKISSEVAALKGGGESDEKLKELEKISTDIVSTVTERIKAETAGKAAREQIGERLKRLNIGLDKMAVTMKTTQKKLVGELSSTNDSVKRGGIKNTLTQGVISSINDIKVAIYEIAAADQKSQIDAGVARFNSAAQAATKSLFMRTEKNTPVGKEITSVITEVTKTVTGVGGIVETRSASLGRADDAARSKVSQEAAATVQKIVKLSGAVGEYATKTNEGTKEDGKKFDRSLENSVMLSDYLAGNAELISYGGSINDAINNMFYSRTPADLDAAKNRAVTQLGKATTLLSTRMKNAEGSGGLSALLREVNSTLTSSNGVFDKLGRIITVNKQLVDLNGKLKNLVMEQRKEGEAGMTSARVEQENAVKSVNTVFRSNIIGVSIIGLVVLIIGVAFSMIMGHSITKPINELSQLAERFGNGDFNCNMDTARKDEFGKLAGHFNTASIRLREIVGDLATAIGQLKASSDTLSGTSGRLREGAQEQTNQAAQSATALEEVSMTVVDVARNAGQAAAVTKESSSIAAQGKATVLEVVNGMNEIARSVGETAAVVQKLGDSSQQIGSIVDVIKDIADQTNLLALNAAIEAARAGETGMGFAVVANEVRNLARRTTEATTEIEGMIKSIQSDTANSIRTMNNGRQLVDRGVERVQSAQSALESIVTASDSGAAMVESIAAASGEQSTVILEVSSGVERMAELTRAAEEDSRHISTEAEELSRIAEDLSRKAAWFKF
jgi:methyl-accepting chemotaxis protein